MTDFSQSFHARASRIPFLGVGLSVDVYSPNLFDLSAALKEHHLAVGYLEIFQAHSQALRTVREHFSTIPLAYHAEGLWFTQPNWNGSVQAAMRLESVARELELLKAWWVNQECASKEIAGFPFGTYVPPLFTEEGAKLTARQVWKAQEELDARQWGKQTPPLVLLEVPPLTFFAVGDLSYTEFFQRVAHWAPCGFVLDLGHVWTAFRYSGGWKTQTFEEFFDVLLEEFPLERVVQIHVAGLACHPSITAGNAQGLGVGPAPWVDSHPAPIPQELFLALGKVLRNTRMGHLKGLALEVDNKDISLICREFEFVQEQFGIQRERFCQCYSGEEEVPREGENFHVDAGVGMSLESLQHEMERQYADYFSLLTGGDIETIGGRAVIPHETKEGVQVYATQYLPQEILSWGGDLSEMFPRSCETLRRHGLGLERFLEFWFAAPWSGEDAEYDFFLMKINRFVEFIRKVLPRELPVAVQEALVLREGYAWSCREVGFSEEMA